MQPSYHAAVSSATVWTAAEDEIVWISLPVDSGDLASKPSRSHCQGVSIYSPISTAFAARSRPNITTSPGNLARRRDQPNAHAQTQVIAASEQTS
jgi:hypothetical protein